MHESLKLNLPCEFIDIKQINPLISKCQIKVLYVDDEEANRNGSLITKEVAKKIAQSLPGSPIVGKYNPDTADFEEHNKILEITNKGITLKEDTKPYGFVDLNARVWFQKYLDDGIEREYLVTEGYLWTGQYPEAQRILTKGNNQSMELDDNLLNGYWSKDYHGNPKFFIINEAIISKLCVLGEEEEPCFEGAQIGKLEFSFNDGFKQQLFGLIESMKEILSKGGEQVFTKYNVQIGDNIWNSIWDNITARESTYSIDGVYQTENEIFAVLKGENDKFYRLNFSNNTEEENLVFSEELEELTDYTSPETPNFDPAAVEEFAATYNIQDDSDSEPNEVEQLKAEKSKVEAELETLKTTYTALENNYQELKGQYEAIKTENTSLKDFKLTIQKKEKQEMINSFYMLSDEDKKDVIDNIDTYSLEDIEAKLSIICVRNKVSFDIGDDTKPTTPTSYTLQNIGEQDDDIPAWIKLVREVEKQN